MQLGIAPQMRQSLEMLQVPLLELRTLIQKEIEQNPTLEERDDEHEPLESEESSDASPEDLEFKEQYEALLKMDDEWRDTFQMKGAAQHPSRDDEARRRFYFESIVQPETLEEHLLSQLSLTDLPEEDRPLVHLLIGSLNDEGYLNVTLGELSETTGLPIERLEAALRVLQDMDPIGIGARDLRECLRLQLDRLGGSDRTAVAVVRDHLEALGANRHLDIARALNRPVEEIYRAARLVATLEPRPSRAFSTDKTMAVTPDVFIQKTGDSYAVQMNNERLPHIRISKFYRLMMENPDTPRETRDYIRDKIRSSTFMIRSIDQRQQTILRIAQEILAAQRDFFDHGLTHLRPLVMTDIAKRVGVHETTVSRAIANKYMQTPRGMFEMKYFFTPGYRSAGGPSVSNKTVMDLLSRLVNDEDAAHPLSDQALAARLLAQGLDVARRTIAKYREELKIPPSHARRMTR